MGAFLMSARSDQQRSSYFSKSALFRIEIADGSRCRFKASFTLSRSGVYAATYQLPSMTVVISFPSGGRVGTCKRGSKAGRDGQVGCPQRHSRRWGGPLFYVGGR